MIKTTIPLLRSIITTGVLSALALSLPWSAFGAEAPRAAAPELSVSLRGLVDDELEQGEPLRVVVRLESSGEGNGIVELAPAAGTWVEAVAVELSAAGGGAVLARATPVGVPASPRATLDRERIAGGMWMFAGGATQGLAPGDYVVRARLAIKGGAGWSGGATSDEVPFKVVGVSAAPERVSARTFVRAQIAFSQGAFEEAARLVDAVLTKTPDDFDLLCLRADVALGGGNPMAAMICVNRAARALAPTSPGPPPLMLHEVQSRVRAAQGAGTASPASPPAWTWPPASVWTLPEKEAAALLDKAVPAAVVKGPSAAQVPVAASASLSAKTTVTPAASPAMASGTARPGAASIGTLVPASELVDAKIRADAAGQWAASARAGSEYGKTHYSAARATGAPNVPVVGNSPDAWCPAVRNVGMDWLEVTFANPVSAVEVRARQSDVSGAIAKVEAIEPDGTAHVWWEGVDPYQAPAVRKIVWFGVRVPRTAYLVARVKFTLNLASGPGYKQIDAVQLLAAGAAQ